MDALLVTPEMKEKRRVWDSWELTKWRHPRTKQFLDHLIRIDFADRYDALCAAHPVRGDIVPKGACADAMTAMNRGIRWSKRLNRHQYRERTGVPRWCGLGLDFSVDARVNIELLWVTPEGPFCGPFHRYVKQIRQLTNPDYRHKAVRPAPRVGSLEELPAILAGTFAIFDDMARVFKNDVWFVPQPKEWLRELDRQDRERAKKWEQWAKAA